MYFPVAQGCNPFTRVILTCGLSLATSLTLSAAESRTRTEGRSAATSKTQVLGGRDKERPILQKAGSRDKERPILRKNGGRDKERPIFR